MMSARRAISAGKSRSSIPPEVCQRNFASQVRFTTVAVDFRLDFAHLLICDDQEIA
jgi:hypothetical protein